MRPECCISAPGAIRTRGQGLRKSLLYPLSYGGDQSRLLRSERQELDWDTRTHAGHVNSGEHFHCRPDAILRRTDVRLHRLPVGVAERMLYIETVGPKPDEGRSVPCAHLVGAVLNPGPFECGAESVGYGGSANVPTVQ